MARVWVDLGTGDWGPVQRCVTACGRLGYMAARWGLGADVVVLLTGPAGPPDASASRPRPRRPVGAVVPGAGPVQVTLNAYGRPAVLLDDLGETWTVTAITGVWVQVAPAPTAAVRAAFRVDVSCWHTSLASGVLALGGDGSWWLRPPR